MQNGGGNQTPSLGRRGIPRFIRFVAGEAKDARIRTEMRVAVTLQEDIVVDVVTARPHGANEQ
jgi:hypothetical protein